MVEYANTIDDIFSALADPVRRDILERTCDGELTVNQIALEYDMSLAAISKHLKVLDQAGLVIKRREGRYIYVRTASAGLNEAAAYLAGFDNQSERDTS